MKKHIPNLLTLLNLSSGILSILFAVIGNLEYAVYCIMAGIFFDFFDGFVARLLGVQGELGKQLDSLADATTSGLAPGMIWFVLLSNAVGFNFFEVKEFSEILPFVAFICPLASVYRLANFNIDTRQSNSFIGLPTPANALLIGGMVFLQNQAYPYTDSIYFILGIGVLGCLMLNANIEMFSLKFKDYSWSKNKSIYTFLLISLFLLIVFKWSAISPVILLYMLWSLFSKKSI